METLLHPSLAVQAIHQLIEHQARQNPDLVAVEMNGVTLTYKDLNVQSNKLAHFLVSKGVTEETIVGISVKRSINMFIAILAIWKAGGAYLPIDPDYPTHRIEYIFADSSLQLLLTEEPLLTHLPPLDIETICLDNNNQDLASCPTTNLPCSLSKENLAYLLYTSGTTGNPKGVMVTHGNLIATYLSWKEIYKLSSNDCHLQMASFSFDVFAGDLMRALCSGAKLVVCPKNDLLRADKLYALIEKHSINCAEFVPTILRRLVDYVKKQHKRFDFMRLLVCGSDSWTLNEYYNLKQFCGPHTRVINSYGLTETTIDSTWYEAEIDPSIINTNQYVPIGKPFPHTTMFLLDHDLNIVANDHIGEIYIGGEGVTRGYFNKPELNKERFVIHKFANTTSPVKLYRTGDKGRLLRDGNIQFLGRGDNQIKLRGIRVELSEIECTINNFPTVKESVVILNEQDPTHPRLVAYIIIEEGTKERLSDLRHFLIENLPNYLIPAIFIPLDSLPLTPNKKVDRENLKHRTVVFHS
ncbi:MAG: non-ribosomal peptide synthetase [Legionella sp.]